jgi:hypothetical protein
MQVVDSIKNKMQNKVAENPFYGKSALLALLQQAGQKNTRNITSQLDAAWRECKGDKVLREAFFVIVFSMGDITNRQHNIFRNKKVDNGGNSMREPFMGAMRWMVKNCPEQYYAFMKGDLFRQYSCLFNVLATQVRTNKGTKQITEVINMLDGVDLAQVAEYVAKIIQSSNPVERSLIAKWLVNPRLSKRQGRDRKTGEKKGSRKLQQKTWELSVVRTVFYQQLSEVMKWEVVKHKRNLQFVGMRNWKKEYNGDLESVLFSSGKITEFDETQFTKWLNTLPSGARYRVRRRLLDGTDKPKGKWTSKFGGDLGQWFLNWEKFKDTAQEEQRVLEEKVRQGDTSEETKEKLQKVKKEAKVNTGAETLFSTFEKVLAGRMTPTEFNQSAQSILDKIKFEVPVLVIADRSGSMTSHSGGLPMKMAQLATTLVMLKNPSDELDNVVVTFGSGAHFYTDRSTGVKKNNRFMKGEAVTVNKLVDREADFITNLTTVSTIVRGMNEGTDLGQVAGAFKRWLDSSADEAERQVKREAIQSYPVFLVMSDGDLNSGPSASQSMAQFQQDMLQWFGWTGVVVVWNVSTDNKPRHDYFQGMQNVVHYFGFNAGIINTIFSKIHDLDIIDVFTPVKSLHESNRYEPVKQNVL